MERTLTLYLLPKNQEQAALAILTAAHLIIPAVFLLFPA
jgi:hypothetical protein